MVKVVNEKTEEQVFDHIHKAAWICGKECVEASNVVLRLVALSVLVTLSVAALRVLFGRPAIHCLMSMFAAVVASSVELGIAIATTAIVTVSSSSAFALASATAFSASAAFAAFSAFAAFAAFRVISVSSGILIHPVT